MTTTLMSGLCLLTGTLACICFYQFGFKEHGPLDISAARFREARQHLAESGEQGQRPLSLMAMCTLIVVMAGDSVFTGLILTGTLFEQYLTPRGALVAALVWSGGCTYLLYKLIFAAAREAVIVEKRQAIRKLMQGDAKAQAKGEAMKVRIGEALGHDYAQDANRKGIRLALAVTVTVLVVATFGMRVLGPGVEGGAAAGSLATPLQEPAPMRLPAPAPARHHTVPI